MNGLPDPVAVTATIREVGITRTRDICLSWISGSAIEVEENAAPPPVVTKRPGKVEPLAGKNDPYNSVPKETRPLQSMPGAGGAIFVVFHVIAEPDKVPFQMLPPAA